MKKLLILNLTGILFMMSPGDIKLKNSNSIESGSRWIKFRPTVFDCFQSCQLVSSQTLSGELKWKKTFVSPEHMEEVRKWAKENLGPLLNKSPEDSGHYSEDFGFVMYFYSDLKGTPDSVVMTIPFSHVFENGGELEFEKLRLAWCKPVKKASERNDRGGSE